MNLKLSKAEQELYDLLCGKEEKELTGPRTLEEYAKVYGNAFAKIIDKHGNIFGERGQP